MKTLTVSVADDFSKEIIWGCKRCSLASLLAFLYFFYTIHRHYCFTLTQIPLLRWLLELTTPHYILLPLHHHHHWVVQPKPRDASWDTSGPTQGKFQIPHLLSKHCWCTCWQQPGVTGLSKHHQTLLQMNNNASITFSWGLPGQLPPLSSSPHGGCKLPDHHSAAWSTSQS